MVRKAEGGGRKLNAKMLLPLLMIYLNYQLDYKNPETLKVVRAGFVVSCGLVRSPCACRGLSPRALAPRRGPPAS